MLLHSVIWTPERIESVNILKMVLSSTPDDVPLKFKRIIPALHSTKTD
jgi:hypothetical protein